MAAAAAIRPPQDSTPPHGATQAWSQSLDNPPESDAAGAGGVSRSARRWDLRPGSGGGHAGEQTAAARRHALITGHERKSWSRRPSRVIRLFTSSVWMRGDARGYRDDPEPAARTKYR